LRTNRADNCATIPSASSTCVSAANDAEATVVTSKQGSELVGTNDAVAAGDNVCPDDGSGLDELLVSDDPVEQAQ